MICENKNYLVIGLLSAAASVRDCQAAPFPVRPCCDRSCNEIPTGSEIASFTKANVPSIVRSRMIWFNPIVTTSRRSIHIYIYIYGACSVKKGLKAFAKGIGSGQPAQSARADPSRYLLLIVHVSANVLLGPFQPSNLISWLLTHYQTIKF